MYTTDINRIICVKTRDFRHKTMETWHYSNVYCIQCQHFRAIKVNFFVLYCHNLISPLQQ